MRYADRFSNFDRFDESIRPLLEGIVFNRQRWRADQSDEDAPLVSDAIKYHSRAIERPDRDEYPNPDEDGYDPYVGTILRDVLGFDSVTPFQRMCWEELNELRNQRSQNGQSQGAILSAPTGFGKTEGFSGPILHDLAANNGAGFGKTIIVYPRNALLEDQLERFLEQIDRLRSDPDFADDLSIGIYNSSVPTNTDSVANSLVRNGEFTLAQWIGGDEPMPLEFYGRPDGYELRADDGTTFDESTLKLSRNASNPARGGEVPDILLTTINSLENFGLKPNYNILDEFRTFVFDEIHLYTETYGSHASNIVRNAKRSIRERNSSDEGLIFIGSSATVDQPKSLGSELFNISESNVRVIRTGPEDKRETEDTEHFHFVSSADNLGTSSTFIQQILLFSHSLLEERNQRERKKALAFIDSKSQVNQRYFQIRDFENERRWQYHDQEQDDWEYVANNTPYQSALPEESSEAHELIEGDLDIEPTSSDIRLNADEFGGTDLILSTSLLEVGIDIPAIKVVSQYRAPWEMSQFVQRIGRASRQSGNDAHFLITLGNDANDRSLFQRAERFLEPEIETPLDAGNKILRWTHDQIYQAFRTSYNLRNSRDRYQNEQQEFLERLLTENEEASFESFYEFAENPQQHLRSHLEQQVDPINPLWDQDSLQRAYSVLSDAKEQQLLEEVADIIGTASTRYTLQVSDLESIDDDVEENILELIESADRSLSDRTPTTESAEDAIEEAQERFGRITDLFDQNEIDRRDRLDQVSELLELAHSELNRVDSEFEDPPEGFIYELNLQNGASAAREARSLRTPEDLANRRRIWRRAYLLQHSLEELYCFVNQETDDGIRYGHLMVRAYKALFRAIYFHNRANVLGTDRGELEPPFYVPTSYFGEAGETFSIVPDDDRRHRDGNEGVDSLYDRRFGYDTDGDSDETEVAITKLFYEYAPYKNKYLEDQSIQLFDPDVEVVPGENGPEYYFNIDAFETEPDQNVITPLTLPLKQVRDHSGDRAQSVVRYCPQCLSVMQGFESNCSSCGGELEYGKLRSDAQIDTMFSPEIATEDNLGVAYVDAEVRLDAVDLTITPASASGDPTSGSSTPFSMDYENEREEHIRFREPLGFSLKTRGAIWDISELYQHLTSDEEFMEQFERLNPVADLEEVVHYTASHFLLGLVSDVTGVNQSQLLYGIDTTRQEVAVFERAEGGQGVVDLFDDVRQRTNHERLLTAINRVCTNPQLINGGLWANDEFVDAVFHDDEPEIERHIRSRVPIATDSVTNSVREAVQSTADQLEEFADVTGVSLDDAYSLRQEMAHRQFRLGQTDVVDEVLDSTPDGVTETAIRNFLVEPDVDGCVENLQLKYNIIDGDQSDFLSYLILEEIQEYVTTSSDGDWGDEMVENEAIPGANINGTNIFHSL